MKNIQVKEKFIQLRAQGLSFERISKEIGISKPTLIKWNRECSDAVANLLFFNIESMLEQYRLLKGFRIEALAQVFKKSLEELVKRNFENIPTEELISLMFTLEAKLKTELSGIKFHTGENECLLEVDANIFKEKTVSMFF